MVWRRNAVWGLMILGLVLLTLSLSTAPRYYLMVMPMLWLGWVLMVLKLAQLLPRSLHGAVIIVGSGFPLLMNTGRVIGFIQDQRRPDWEWLVHGADRNKAFLDRYRSGAIPPLQGLAALIAEHTNTKDTIIGPSAHILAYFADRRVLGERSIFFEKALSTYPDVLKKLDPHYAIFPSNLYESTDPRLRDLMRRRIVVAMDNVGANEYGYLARVDVRPPPGNEKWTSYNGPDERASATTRRSKGKAPHERAELAQKKLRKLEIEKRTRKEKRDRIDRLKRIERREKLERQEKIERRERLERIRLREVKERRARKARNASPSTAPTTAPLGAADVPFLGRPMWLVQVSAVSK